MLGIILYLLMLYFVKKNMKRFIFIILLMISKSSFASFPVVEKVSDQTTGSMTDPGLSSYFPYYANIWFYIWGIGAFIQVLEKKILLNTYFLVGGGRRGGSTFR